MAFMEGFFKATLGWGLQGKWLFSLVDGEVMGWCLRILIVNSRSAHSHWPLPGMGLSSCRVTQKYMSDCCVYPLRGNLGAFIAELLFLDCFCFYYLRNCLILCMLSHVISSWSATWSVYDQPHDQCMRSHVISLWSATCSVHVQSRDQCMISHLISAWSATWSLYDQPHDQCMRSHVISLWSATCSEHDRHVINAW